MYSSGYAVNALDMQPRHSCWKWALSISSTGCSHKNINHQYSEVCTAIELQRVNCKQTQLLEVGSVHLLHKLKTQNIVRQYSEIYTAIERQWVTCKPTQLRIPESG
jgi:uncharacterized lipoprotein YmbA